MLSTGAWEEPELERAGDAARGLTKAVMGGEGAVREPESRCLCIEPFGNGEGGAKREVGVAVGVLWLDPASSGPRGGPISPVY